MGARGTRERSEGKVARGWRLTQVAWRLIRSDPTVLRLALVGIGSATLLGGLVCVLGGCFSGGARHAPSAIGALLLIYPAVLVGVFFNVALACAASAALDGDPLEFGEALRIAWGKRGRIAAWSAISLAIGMLIAQITSRLPGGERIFGRLAGIAWGLGTLFVVPILAMEGIGPIDATKRSFGLVRSRWGEGLSGGLAIGAWAVLAAIPAGIAAGVGVALAPRHPGSGLALLAVGVVGLIVISVFAASTRQVFAVALYRYAIDAPIGGFAPDDLAYPFRARRDEPKRKSWILRIGGAILALFAVLALIGALFGHGRGHTAAEGYFHLDYASRAAPPFRPGAPVVYRRMPIGEVTAVRLDGGVLWVEFHVAPAARGIVETSSAYPVGPATEPSLCLGTARECGRGRRSLGAARS